MKAYYNGHSKKGGVYKIVNTRNGRSYYGSAKEFKRRRTGHLSSLRNNKHSNKYLQGDYNKCGEEAFEFHVIEVVSGDKAARLLCEQGFLDQYYDGQDTCYNFAKEARTPEGTFPKDSVERRHRRSEAFRETWAKNREQMSKSLRERWQDPAFRKRVTEAQKRAAKTPLGKAKIRKAIRASNKACAKSLHLISPDGVEYKGQNIAAFCRIHELDFRQISDVVKGRRRTAGGWKTFANRKMKHRLVSPGGVVHAFDFQKKFAREHNLSYHQIWKLLHEKIDSHKSWKLFTP